MFPVQTERAESERGVRQKADNRRQRQSDDLTLSSARSLFGTGIPHRHYGIGQCPLFRLPPGPDLGPFTGDDWEWVATWTTVAAEPVFVDLQPPGRQNGRHVPFLVRL